MATTIPSPEEIAKYLERKDRNPSIEPLAHGTQKNVATPEEMEREINALKSKVAKKQRSAKELQEAMFLLMERYNFTPAEELVKLVTEKAEGGGYKLDQLEGTPKMRIGILETLLEYTAPKLKSVEITGAVEHTHTINVIRWGDDGSVKKEPLKAPVTANQVAGTMSSLANGDEAKIIDVEVASV